MTADDIVAAVFANDQIGWLADEVAQHFKPDGDTLVLTDEEGRMAEFHRVLDIDRPGGYIWRLFRFGA